MEENKLQFCSEESHEEEELVYLCLNKDCKFQSRFFCQLCVVQTTHLFEHKDQIISVHQLVKQNQLFIDNWPPVPELKDLVRQSKQLKPGTKQSFAQVIKYQLERIKEDFIKEIDKQQKNIIQAINDQEIENQNLFQEVNNKFTQSYQLRNLRTIVSSYLENKNDLSQTLEQLQTYTNEIETKPDIQEILKLYKDNKPAFKKTGDQIQKITSWINNQNFIKQVQDLSKRITNYISKQLSEIQFQQISESKDEQLEQYIKDLEIVNLSESNMQFKKHQYGISSSIIQDQNEYQFGNTSCCYLVSEQFESKDQVILKFEVVNFIINETYRATNYSLIGVKSFDIASQNTCQHSKNSGIVCAGHKGNYEKGTLFLKGNDLDTQIKKNNQVFYLYVCVNKNRFVLFDEKKECIFYNNNSSSDFENKNSWAIVLGTAYHSMKVKILNFIKVQE